MCGIAGLVTANPGANVSTHDARKNAVVQMLRALQHRGPDGEGIHQDESVTLGHRRLSIIDLEGGAQPLKNVEHSTWLVCNGEIYNYRQLRRQLENDGHRFLTGSDCEVIIALYERHGDRLLDYLRGMFAFALWDAHKKRLLIARDHLGQKPLFYSYTNGVFAFASEIKALLAGVVSPRLNLAALDQYLALRLIEAPLTMYEGIHKLPPGHLLVVEPGSPPSVRRYWDLPVGETLPGNEDELCDELEQRVTTTLDLHRVSDVPVGAFLSGGLDSSLLVAMLSRRLGVRELPTFTMSLDYKRYDEAPAARQVARLFGTQHHEARVAPEVAAMLPDLVMALDEPSDPLSLCTYLLARFTRQHVKVVIGGDGGDELFGGYDRYFGNLYAAYYQKVPASVRRKLLAPAFSLIPEAGWYKSLGHQLRWLDHLAQHTGGARYAASLSYFYFDRQRRAALYTSEVRDACLKYDAEGAIRVPYDETDGDAVARMLYVDSKVRLPNHPVMITDRICMAHGLEARSPFMDHTLAEFAARLPSSLKIRGSTLRYIQRKLAARYLPAEILNRPKQGFSSALPYLLQSQYGRLFRNSLADSQLARDGILDRTVVQRLIAEHTQRKADHGQRLWLLINAEVWYRLMILRQSQDDLRRELAAAA